MRKGQVYVRAITKEGYWGNVDVLDLDEQSFRAVVVGKLLAAGLFFAVPDELVEGPEVILRERSHEHG